MKKAVSILLLGLLLTGLFGCAPVINQQVSPTDTAGNANNTTGEIGLSLSAENSFNSDFTAEFTRLSQEGGYRVVTKTAGGDYKKQTEDILTLVNAGVKIVVVDPVNIDQLDTAIGECETANVPVIDLLQPINEVTEMLIAPDYKEMGSQAAEACKALLTKGDKAQGKVLALQGSFDSFLMQMLHDGFNEGLPASETLTVDAPYCDFDMTKAYNAAKQAIGPNGAPDVIFAQSESMAKGAIKAVDEAKASIKIVTIGADAEIVSAIKNKKISAAVYVSPKELATKASQYVQQYIKDNNAKLPTYAGLTIGYADGENAASLVAPGSKYANLPDENSGAQDAGEPETSESAAPSGSPEAGTSGTPAPSDTAGE